MNRISCASRFSETVANVQDVRHFAPERESFPRGRLVVVNQVRFETERIRGVTLEDFLRSEWTSS